MIEYSDDVSDVFKALADPTRRGILEQLDGGPATVSALAAPFEISLAAVVQHVQVLERCRLVTTTKTGRERLCRLDQEGVSTAEGWLHARRARWQSRLDRLEQHLDKNTNTNTNTNPDTDTDTNPDKGDTR